MGRYDPGVLQEPARRLRVALRVPDGGAWDVVLAGTAAQIVAPTGRPDAIIVADSPTWDGIATDTGGALAAYLAGRLSVRRNLHVGVAFLAATSGSTQRARMGFDTSPPRVRGCRSSRRVMDHRSWQSTASGPRRGHSYRPWPRFQSASG